MLSLFEAPSSKLLEEESFGQEVSALADHEQRSGAFLLQKHHEKERKNHNGAFLKNISLVLLALAGVFTLARHYNPKLPLSTCLDHTCPPSQDYTSADKKKHFFSKITRNRVALKSSARGNSSLLKNLKKHARLSAALGASTGMALAPVIWKGIIQNVGGVWSFVGMALAPVLAAAVHQFVVVLVKRKN
jgi:hypothetical protein